jgi:hypothetical protein
MVPLLVGTLLCLWTVRQAELKDDDEVGHNGCKYLEWSGEEYFLSIKICLHFRITKKYCRIYI